MITVRGSRPIDNDLDDMFVVRIGDGVQFFGHPDFFHDPDTRQPLPVILSRTAPTPGSTPSRAPVALPGFRLFGPVSGETEGRTGLRRN